MTVQFQNLGIQHVKVKDIVKSLDERHTVRVDPFRQGFEHGKDPGSLDLSRVRLCFQVFLRSGALVTPLPPVCSEPIVDAKAWKELQIVKLSETTSMPEGGKEMLILCNRINRHDIKVRFFNDIWEHFASFDPDTIHMQCAITLKIPPYKDQFLTEPKEVWVQLVKMDGSTSKPVRFIYTANMSELTMGPLPTESWQKSRLPMPSGFHELRNNVEPEWSPTPQSPEAGTQCAIDATSPFGNFTPLYRL